MRCTRHLCRFVPELREYSVVVSRPRASAGCRGVRSRGAVTVGGRAVRNTGVGAPLLLLPVFRVVRCPGCRGAVVCVRRREAASGSCRLCFAAVGRSGARGHRLLAAAVGSFRLCFVPSVVPGPGSSSARGSCSFVSSVFRVVGRPGRGVIVCVRRRDGRFGALLRAGLPWLRLPETLRVAVGFGRPCRVCPSSGMLDDDRVAPSDRRTCRVMRHRSRMRQSVRRWRPTAERIVCGCVGPCAVPCLFAGTGVAPCVFRTLFQPGCVARDDADADRLDALRRTHGSDRQPIGAGAG